MKKLAKLLYHCIDDLIASPFFWLSGLDARPQKNRKPRVFFVE